MSLFHENIRQILTEVEKFLNETLKKESKLGKKTLEHKQLILDRLIKFYEENPQMKPVPSQDSISVKEADDASLTGSSRSDESEDPNYIDAGIGLIPATDLKDPVLTGFLEKKQKKGSGIFGGGGKFQKRWCIVHAGNFYYYSSVKDKQQNGSFKLEGYRFRNAPDLSSKKAEKELCFELYHEYAGKRTYQFMAKNKTEYEEWQNVLENGGHPLIEEDIYEEVGAEESPGATSPGPTSAPVQLNADVEVKVDEPPDGEVYEDPDADIPPPPPPSFKGSHKPPPSPVPKSPVVKVEDVKPEPEPEESDELYDDASSVEPLKRVEPPAPIHTRLPPPPPEPVEAPSQPPEVPPPVKRGTRPQRDLPPPPPKKKKIKLNITCKPEEDFESRFYGKWDCTGDCSNELSFKKGDIIYVLSKDFDEKSWWVGELNGKFGLVPKTFLTPAYTLMA